MQFKLFLLIDYLQEIKLESITSDNEILICPLFKKMNILSKSHVYGQIGRNCVMLLEIDTKQYNWEGRKIAVEYQGDLFYWVE